MYHAQRLMHCAALPELVGMCVNASRAAFPCPCRMLLSSASVSTSLFAVSGITSIFAPVLLATCTVIHDQGCCSFRKQNDICCYCSSVHDRVPEFIRLTRSVSSTVHASDPLTEFVQATDPAMHLFMCTVSETQLPES